MKALEAGKDPYLGFLDFPTLRDWARPQPSNSLAVGWRPSFLQLTVFCTMLMLLLLRAQLLQARKDRQPFCYNSGSKALLPYHWRKETQFVSDLQAQSVVDPSDCTGTSGCALISSTCIYKWRNGVSEESSSSPSDNWDPKVTTSWCRDT